MNIAKLASIAASLFLFAVAAFAGLPQTISYQGYLKDITGTPVNSPLGVPMTFSLYSSMRPESGAVWQEPMKLVPVTNGIYSTTVGSSTQPVTAPFDVPYYLGIDVDGTKLPRQPFSSAPYAFKAGCNPGDMVACYTGPSATLGIAPCKGGTRTCAADGSAFGPCIGETTPVPEVRDNLDNDCNGVVDDGLSFCEPGTSVACYTGPGGTMGIGDCHTGLMTCNAEGSAYGPCIGAGLPAPEVCDGKDNNCDGAVDNGISYPPVTNGTYVCNLGTTVLTCNSGFAGCASSGCDTNIMTDLQHCGMCGNGCETNTVSDANHCGGCGISCGVGGFCVNSTCMKPLGSVCTSNSQCTSGFCVDGYCCNSLCSGTCQSCNQPGSVGLCSPIPAGTDPANECTDQGASSCGTNGLCSGSGSCAYYPNGTQSSASYCSAGIYHAPDTCNGAGSSISGGTALCFPYICSSNGTCRTSCAINSDCSSGYECASGGACKKAAGGTCTADSECGSGFCTDGVCCQSRCGGTCEKCNQLGRYGFCDPVPAGSDPDNECVSQPESSCGTTGLCGGNRSCAYYTSGTLTGLPSCSISDYTAASTCNGSGGSTPGVTTSCYPYICNDSTSCKTSCLSDTDCIEGLSCINNTCE